MMIKKERRTESFSPLRHNRWPRTAYVVLLGVCVYSPPLSRSNHLSAIGAKEMGARSLSVTGGADDAVDADAAVCTAVSHSKNAKNVST